MKKIMTRAISLLAVAMMLMSFMSAFAAAATLEDYKAANDDQKAYYNNIYKPVYAQYQQTIRNFRAFVRDSKKVNTKAEYEKIVAELKAIVAGHRAFYGTRTTVGTSRYEVPVIREAMYTAADKAKNYDRAIEFCADLKAAVKKRVDYMEAVMAKINALQNAVEEEVDPLDLFTTNLRATPKNKNIFAFDLVITNNSDEAVNNFTYDVVYDGFSFAPSKAFIGSGLTVEAVTGGHIVLSGVSVPAHSSIVIPAGVNAKVATTVDAAKITGATINGKAIAAAATVVA